MKNIKVFSIRNLILIASVCTLSACSFGSRSVKYDLASEQAKADLIDAKRPSVVAELPPQRAKNEIAPGFLIKIASSSDAKLNGKFRVEFDGQLELPYGVVLQAGGITISELRQRIGAAYSNYFVGQPDVSVTIDADERFVEVGGLVMKPGRFVVRPQSSLDELIAKAGGLLPSKGNGGEYAAKYANVTQEGSTRMVRLSEYYAGARNLIPAWRGGDKVFFQSEGEGSASAKDAEKDYIQVLGQVGTPGEYTFEKGVDFFYYLAKAGGPKEKADLDKIEIIRLENGSRVSIRFKMSNIDKIPAIKGGDIILVHTDRQDSTITNVAAAVSAAATSVIAGSSL